MEDKRKNLYEALSQDYELGSYDDFNKSLENEDSRKALYEAASADYDLGSFEDFNNSLFPSAQQTPQTSPAVGVPQRSTSVSTGQPAKSIDYSKLSPVAKEVARDLGMEDENKQPSALKRAWDKGKGWLGDHFGEAVFWTQDQIVKNGPYATHSSRYAPETFKNIQRKPASQAEIDKWDNNPASEWAKQQTNLIHFDANKNDERVDSDLPWYIAKTKGQISEELDKSLSAMQEHILGLNKGVLQQVLDAEEKGKQRIREANEAANIMAAAGGSPLARDYAQLNTNKLAEREGNRQSAEELKKLNAELSEKLQSGAYDAMIEKEANRIGVSPDYYRSFLNAQLYGDNGLFTWSAQQARVNRSMPSSTAEYILSGVANSSVGSLLSGLAHDKQNLNERDMAIAAYEEVAKPSFWAKAGNMTAMFVADAPLFGITGRVSAGAVAQVSRAQLARLMASGASREEAMAALGAALEASFGRRAADAMVKGMVGGSVNLATFNAVSETLRETSRGDIDAGNILSSAAHGMLTGAALGVAGGAYGAATDKLAGVQKGVAAVGGIGVEGAAMGATDYATSGKSMKEAMAEGMLTAMVAKVSSTVTHPAGLRKRFQEALQGKSHSDVNFSAAEIAEIRESTGARNLLDALITLAPRDGRKTKGSEAAFTSERNGTINFDETAHKMARDKMDKAYNALMNDPNVSYTAKQKIANLMGGKMATWRPAARSVEYDAQTKSVNIYDADGWKIEQRTFKSAEEAHAFYNEMCGDIARGVGQTRDASVLAQAVKDVSRQTGIAEDKLMQEVQAAITKFDRGRAIGEAGKNDRLADTKVVKQIAERVAELAKADTEGMPQGNVRTVGEGETPATPQMLTFEEQKAAQVAKRVSQMSDADKRAVQVKHNMLEARLAEKYGEDFDERAALPEGMDADPMWQEYNRLGETLAEVTAQADAAFTEKRDAAFAEIEQRVGDDGEIRPAVLNGGKRVYVTSGRVLAAGEDTGIDRENSDKTVTIFNPETGKVEMVDIDELSNIEAAISPDAQRAEVESQLSAERDAAMQMQQHGSYNMSEGQQYVVIDEEGQERNVTIIANDGQGNVMVDVDGQQAQMTEADLRKNLNYNDMQLSAREWDAEHGIEATKGEVRPTEPTTDPATAAQPIDSTLPAELPAIEAGDQLTIGGKQVMVNSVDTDGLSVVADGVETFVPSAVLESMVENVSRGGQLIYDAPNRQETTASSASNVVIEPNKPAADVAPTTAETPLAETEAAEDTALSHIPTDEQGTPLFEQVDAETAWDGVVEYLEDAGDAQEYVESMVAQLEKEAKQAATAVANVKPSSDIAAFKAAKTTAREAQAVADARLAHWQQMAEVSKARQEAISEAQRAEDIATQEAQREQAAAETAAREAARAQREAEEAAKAEDARKEREALNGVPDVANDKAEDARKRGYRSVNGMRVDRQEPINGVVGRESRVKFSDTDTAKGRIKVVEVEQLQPSHIGGQRNPAFFIDEAQPKERTDEASSLAADQIAANINPEEITGDGGAYQFSAPTVNTRGEVIQGNNRTEALRRMYGTSGFAPSATAYKHYLMEHADEFGLDADAIAAMKHPVMVNEVDVSDAEAIRLGQMKASNIESGGVERIDPVTTSRKLGQKMGNFASVLLSSPNEDASLSELIAENGLKAIKWLASQKAISNTAAQSAFDRKGNLTPEGRMDLQNVLKHALFEGGVSDLPLMFDAMPAKAQRAVLATFMRDFDSPADQRVLPELQNAIAAWYGAAMANPEFRKASNYNAARAAMTDYTLQTSFTDTARPTEKFSNFAMELAARLQGTTMRGVQQNLNDLFDLIQGKGSGDIFGTSEMGEQLTVAEAIKRVFGIDYKPLNQQDNGNGQILSVPLVQDGGARASGRHGAAGDTGLRERETRGGGTSERGTRAGRTHSEGQKAAVGEIAPIGRGVFGDIYDQFKGKAKEAIDFLRGKKSGEAVGALHHKEVGDISLVWGDRSHGLAHILEKHPKVADNLQGALDDMHVVQSSDNRIVLESNTQKAVVSKMLGNEETPQWLLTAYEKKPASGGSSDIVPEPAKGKQNGTAPLQDTASSTGKDSENSESAQEFFPGESAKFYKKAHSASKRKIMRDVLAGLSFGHEHIKTEEEFQQAYNESVERLAYYTDYMHSKEWAKALDSTEGDPVRFRQNALNGVAHAAAEHVARIEVSLAELEKEATKKGFAISKNKSGEANMPADKAAPTAKKGKTPSRKSAMREATVAGIVAPRQGGSEFEWAGEREAGADVARVDAAKAKVAEIVKRHLGVEVSPTDVEVSKDGDGYSAELSDAATARVVDAMGKATEATRNAFKAELNAVKEELNSGSEELPNAAINPHTGKPYTMNELADILESGDAEAIERASDAWDAVMAGVNAKVDAAAAAPNGYKEHKALAEAYKSGNKEAIAESETKMKQFLATVGNLAMLEATEKRVTEDKKKFKKESTDAKALAAEQKLLKARIAQVKKGGGVQMQVETKKPLKENTQSQDTHSSQSVAQGSSKENTQSRDTYSSQMKNDAKVQRDAERRKQSQERLAAVAEKYKNATSDKGVLTDLGKALGAHRLNDGASQYALFNMPDGNVVSIRISNHNANADTYNEHGTAEAENTSIVIKTRKRSNTFKANEDVSLTEHVYMREDIANDGSMLSQIATSLAEMLESGKYADTTGKARVNVSPRSTVQYSVESERKGGSNALKEAQLAVINEHNPMLDDYHTGIRSTKDIKTFEEMLDAARSGDWAEYGEFAYPDMDMEMLEAAQASGHITVYSSYPIEQGVFVTPSRMNASDYAGGGKVYSKRVSVNDVAWISEEEGQFAHVDNAEALKRDTRNDAQSPTPQQRALGEAAVELLRGAGIDVVMDESAMRDVLEASEQLQEMTVYHGSGAVFEAFDHSHMGEGEGAQAYGWGTYVTEVNGIARSYAEAYPKKIDIATISFEEINEELRRKSDGYKATKVEKRKRLFDLAISFIEEWNGTTPIVSGAYAKMVKGEISNKDYSVISTILYHLQDRNTQQKIVYTVEIPEDNGTNYLVWDKEYSFDEVIDIANALTEKSNSEEFFVEDFFPTKEDPINEVVSGRGIYTTIALKIGDRQASELLSSLGYVGIKYPAEYQSGGRTDGAKNYVIFNEKDAQITSREQFLRTAKGEVYGFVKDGKVYLDPKLLNPNTPIHEYTHLWDTALQKANPELWKRGVELMKQTPLWQEVLNNPAYADIAHDENLVASEVHARLTGEKGARLFERMAEEAAQGGVFEKAQTASLISRLKKWVKDAWQWVKDTMTPWTKAEAEGVSLEDFVNMPLKDLVESKKFEQSEDNMAEVNERFNAQLSEMTEKNADSTIFSLGRPTAVLRSAGVEDKAMKLYGSKVVKKMKKHSFALEELRDLPRAVANPIAVFNNYQKDSNRSILTELRTAQGNFLVSLDLGKGDDVDFNIISSVFGKTDNKVAEWIKKGFATYINKEKALNYLHLSAPIAEASNNKELSSVAKIVENFENPTIESDNNLYRILDDSEDAQLIERLEAEPKEKVYRAMVQIDGKLYPPMATYLGKGELNDGLEIGQWVEADEMPEKMIWKNGKAYFRLRKPDGSTVDARYNPYIHTSRSPLNDQFSSAQSRPEIVIVETEVPTSELTSGYKADGAKDSVGEMDWKSGGVSAKLPADKKRKVILSRWGKPVRVVPYSEVADRVQEMFDGIDVTFPSNVLHPELRAELEKRGFKVEETDNQGKPVTLRTRNGDGVVADDMLSLINDPWAKMGMQRSAAQQKKFAEAERKRMTARAKALQEKLGVPVRVLESTEGLTGKKAKAKGWFDPKTGEITIVVPNHTSTSDIEKTMLHEAVAHRGLRDLFGKQFDTFLDNVYKHADERIRRKIAEKAQKHGWNFRTATEEYLADLAEDTNFEEMEQSPYANGWWTKIKELFLKMLHTLGFEYKGSTLSDNELRYVLWRSYKNLTEPGRYRSILGKAEDVATQSKLRVGEYEQRGRKRTEEAAEGRKETLFREGEEEDSAPYTPTEEEKAYHPRTLEESVADAMLRLAEGHKERGTVLAQAMKAIDSPLAKLRKAASMQREYDRATVNDIVGLARVMLKHGLFNGANSREIGRLLTAIRDANGKKDITKHAQTLIDLMVDRQLKQAESVLDRLLKTKGKKLNAAGVEVLGSLDASGQRTIEAMKRGMKFDEDGLEQAIGDAMDRVASSDATISAEAADELRGLELAKRYQAEMRGSEAEEAFLKGELKTAKEAHKSGAMSDEEYREFVKSTHDAIRENRMERLQALRDITASLGEGLRGSAERAKASKDADLQRIREIQHNANSDMEGRDVSTERKKSIGRRLMNSSGMQFFLSPLANFDKMLTMFGNKATDGHGYLWNRYIRQLVQASNKEWEGVRSANEKLNKKVSEVMGRAMTWSDLYKVEQKLPKITVQIKDFGSREIKAHELTQGQALYIYMANKMTDGKMKLANMGITEEVVERIREELDPRFVALGDWVQAEFLPSLRGKYNETHKRLFGANMAAVENYFPLRIQKNALSQQVDISDPQNETSMPTTATGSIIKRRRNGLPLDVLNTDAFSVVVEHVQEMEHWNAYAEFGRDINTLLSYKRFRNQVENMHTVYGNGKTLWNNFRDAARVAAGTYYPTSRKMDKTIVNISKLVTGAKISFRMFTAFKQMSSWPAFLADARIDDLAKSAMNPVEAFNWAIENLPMFAKRWQSRQGGNEKLQDTDMDWSFWSNNFVKTLSRWGLTPNAFVDAVTVAIGGRAIYNTKLRQYRAAGYSEEAAQQRAKEDAAIIVNQTQQSSESPFLAPVQLDRSLASTMFTVFRNGPIGYQRNFVDGVRNLGRMIKGGGEYKRESIAFMAKQMVRDGVDPDMAQRAAERTYNRAWFENSARIAVFGFICQLAWNMMRYVPYMLFGDDDDKKKEMMADAAKHARFGGMEGLAGGNLISDGLHNVLTGDMQAYTSNELLPMFSDWNTLKSHAKNDALRASNDLINLAVQMGTGVNPQTLTDAVVATYDAFNGDLEGMKEFEIWLLRVLQTPQSAIDNLYLDEVGMSRDKAKGASIQELAKRYAKYKRARQVPLMQWVASEGSEAEIEAKTAKRFMKDAKQKLEATLDANTREKFDELVAERNEVDNRIKALVPVFESGSAEEKARAKEEARSLYTPRYEAIVTAEAIAKNALEKAIGAGSLAAQRTAVDEMNTAKRELVEAYYQDVSDNE